MELRRFKDIIAIKNSFDVSEPDSFIAFHARNMEVAEISKELFEEMALIDATTSEVPAELTVMDLDAREALGIWETEINPDAKSGKLEFGIRSITININQICNLKCSYCAAGGDGTYGEPMNQISVEKTLPQLKFFLSKLKVGHKFSLTFVGGEPLLNPEPIRAVYNYVELQSELLGIRPGYTVVTNGTLITDKTADLLRSMRINVTFSIDGKKEINDIVRPTKNGSSSTDLTIAGIQKLTANRGLIPSIGFAAVFSEGNEELIANYSFFKTMNPDWIEFNFAYSSASKELQKNYLLQMSKLAQIAWQAGGETELRKLRVFDHYFRMLDSQQLIENHCGAGKTYLMVDAKNRLYSCPWETGKKEEVVGQGEQLDNLKLANYAKPLIELNNCQSCWARHLCGGGCMYIHKEHTGSKHLKDNLFCERTRSLILVTLLYYKRARSAEQ